MSSELPEDIARAIGKPVYPATADFAAELGYGWNTLAATENGNPLYWDEAVARTLTGGRILPLSTLSIWMRPHRWSPGAHKEQVALQAHFDLKSRLGLPEAIMSDNVVTFHEPVRPGDMISHRQVLRSVSRPKTTRLGAGRFWVIDVEYRNQHGDLVGVESYTGFGYRRSETAETAAEDGSPKPLGAESNADTNTAAAGIADRAAANPNNANRAAAPCAKNDPTHDQVRVGERLAELDHDVTATTVVLGAVASRDWRPMHHDYRFATERNGTRDIFLNTPNQLAWFERAITDWSGPRGRLGRMSFRMRDPVYPGERMTISATITATPVDDAGCGWAELDLALQAGDRICSTGTARIALPNSTGDNPWTREGDLWRP